MVVTVIIRKLTCTVPSKNIVLDPSGTLISHPTFHISFGRLDSLCVKTVYELDGKAYKADIDARKCC